MELRSPASVDEAVCWLRAGTINIDTPANRLRQAQESLVRLFERGHRRPDLVWAAFEGDRMIGITAGREMPDGFRLLDVFALGDAGDALLRRATEWAREGDSAEATFGAPLESMQVAEVRELVERLEREGWQLMVTRQHYEVAPDDLPRAEHPVAGTIEQAQAGDELRLAKVMQRVLVGSLDVRDRDVLEQHGELAGEIAARELIEEDPIEYVHFAVVNGQDAGVAVWRTLPSDLGVVAFVGVAHDARGLGLGRGLLSRATLELIDEGATTLIADTDDANVPMRRAFEAVGWVPSEARIDLRLVG